MTERLSKRKGKKRRDMNESQWGGESIERKTRKEVGWGLTCDQSQLTEGVKLPHTTCMTKHSAKQKAEM